MSSNTGQGNNGIIVTLEAFNLKRVTKEELHEQYVQQADKARELSQKLQEAYTEIAMLKEQDQKEQLTATIAAHEKTIAELEAKVAELKQWPAIASEMARNNTRLTTTLDNMAKAAAGLVPTPNMSLTPR